MCGRYVRASSPREIAARFDAANLEVDEREPDYNVAPRATVPVVVAREPDQRVVEPMRWGLIPSWAKDKAMGDRLINARAETVAEKPAFKRSFARRRCVIPADAFYEWQRVASGPGKARKQPMLIRRRDGDLLAFAGLWDAWRPRGDEDARWVRSCVIVTTRANDALAPVHDRMPVVLDDEGWRRWLDPTVTDVSALGSLLGPAPSDWFELHPVSTAVNTPTRHGPELAEPVELPVDGR